MGRTLLLLHPRAPAAGAFSHMNVFQIRKGLRTEMEASFDFVGHRAWDRTGEGANTGQAEEAGDWVGWTGRSS